MSRWAVLLLYRGVPYKNVFRERSTYIHTHRCWNQAGLELQFCPWLSKHMTLGRAGHLYGSVFSPIKMKMVISTSQNYLTELCRTWRGSIEIGYVKSI